VGALAVLAIAGWGALALAVVGPGGDTGRLFFAGLYGLASLAAVLALLLRRGLRLALTAFAVALLAIGLWWNGLKPSNERDWQPEVARLAYATIDGDLVTVHNVRNFDYRSETDFTPAYYAGERGIASIHLEGAAQRLYAGVCVREGTARPEPALRGAQASIPRQCRRPGCRSGAALLTPHPRRALTEHVGSLPAEPFIR